MRRWIASLLASAALLTVAPAAVIVDHPTTFLMSDTGGLVFLSPNGEEQERVKPRVTIGALSPDGHWMAGLEYNKESQHSKLMIRSRRHAAEPVEVPSISVAVGEGCTLVWSADSKRLLIGQQIRNNGVFQSSCHVYDLTTKKLNELKLPDEYWVTGWSPDGKRFLSYLWRRARLEMRIAWLNADGTGEPEFITSEEERASGGRLSPDGKRMLCLVGPKAVKGERRLTRLCVIDLTTKKRTFVDESGETDGYCWSPDGSRIAYTWQRHLDKPAEVPERVTLLYTCNADGTNRQTITSRKHTVSENSAGRNNMVYFFSVHDWR